MKYALAMVAAGGAMGLASQASATTTVTLNIGANSSPTDIFLAGATNAQFTYGHHDEVKIGPYDFPDSSKLGAASPGALADAPVFTPGLPSPSEAMTSQSYKAVINGTVVNPSDFYLHLKFDDDLGDHYLGSAHFDDVATLESITYAPAGVPEPDTWALLIGGMGLAGAAMRRKRHNQAQAAIG